MTTKRFGHIQSLVTLRAQVASEPSESDRIIRRAIVDALPDGYRKIYDWIGSCYYPVTSRSVARAWDIKPNHSSSVLKELWQFGLLKREASTDEYGMFYEYRIAD